MTPATQKGTSELGILNCHHYEFKETKCKADVVKFILSCLFLVLGVGILTKSDRLQENQNSTIISTSVPASYSTNLTAFTPIGQKEFLSSFGNLCARKSHTIVQNSSSMNPIKDLYIQLEQTANENSDLLEREKKLRRKRAEEIRKDLWKFCALGTGYASTYVDFDQVHTGGVPVGDIIQDSSMNYAVLHEYQTGGGKKKDGNNDGTIQIINPAIISLGQTISGRKIAIDMVNILLLANAETLLSESNYGIWKGVQLNRLIQRASKHFIFLHSNCTGLHQIGVMSGKYHSHDGLCSRSGGAPCCQVEYSSKSLPNNVFLVKHGVEAYGISGDDGMGAFESQVSAIETSESQFSHVINGRVIAKRLFDTLLVNDCLPSNDCHRCLSKQKGGDKITQCQACENQCACYCQALCKNIRPRQIKEIQNHHVETPVLKKTVNRLIPKIVHQTYFEPVTKEKYPNFSRLVETWKQSGWEYKFYLDVDAENFISKHFPPEVREAYDLLLAGAYKADFFRYCILLIEGGIYVDIDVMLSADLDRLIGDDIGFMVPIDEPGRENGAGSCLWNGMLAAAPGHPFIAKTIEMTINIIRNRYTSVDIDNMLCPVQGHHRMPDLELSHSYDLLYLTGPCTLGGAVNTVLGAHIQTQIEPGVMNTRNSIVSSDDVRHLIPGRTIILNQNKTDMGSHRFTYLEKNLIAATTDMPDFDDRKGAKHYSDAKQENGGIMFGLKDVYKDLHPAYETIRVVVEG